MAKAKKKSQKKKYEKHHIVAKSATAAGPSRAILKKHGIGINSNTNLVSIKYNLHRHLHTKSYYTSVNNLLKKVQGSKKKVLQALTSIKSILLAASMAAP